jgi:hypothetical protein
MRRTTLAILATLAALGLASCGDDDQSSVEAARDEACDARSEVRDGLDAVAEDIRAGNLGDAQDDIAALRDDLVELGTAVADLTEEQRAAVQPQVDAISDALGAISLDDLGSVEAAFDTVRAEVDTALDTIESSSGLDC